MVIELATNELKIPRSCRAMPVRYSQVKTNLNYVTRFSCDCRILQTGVLNETVSYLFRKRAKSDECFIATHLIMVIHQKYNNAGQNHSLLHANLVFNCVCHYPLILEYTCRLYETPIPMEIVLGTHSLWMVIVLSCKFTYFGFVTFLYPIFSIHTRSTGY